MYSDLFSQKSVQDLLTVLPSLPLAVWETFYVTVVSTALSLVIGLPLGVLLVVGEKNGVLPLPRWLMQVLNVIINLLRSIPFLILMIMVFPLSRLLIGTAVGAPADTQRRIQRQRAGGDGLHVHLRAVAQTHDRTLAEVLVDLGKRRLQCLFLVRRGGGGFINRFLCSHNQSSFLPYWASTARSLSL